MANVIVGGILALIVLGAAWKLARDKRAGKGSCSCGGDCCSCKACAHGEKRG